MNIYLLSSRSEIGNVLNEYFKNTEVKLQIADDYQAPDYSKVDAIMLNEPVQFRDDQYRVEDYRLNYQLFKSYLERYYPNVRLIIVGAFPIRKGEMSNYFDLYQPPKFKSFWDEIISVDKEWQEAFDTSRDIRRKLEPFFARHNNHSFIEKGSYLRMNLRMAYAEIENKDAREIGEKEFWEIVENYIVLANKVWNELITLTAKFEKYFLYTPLFEEYKHINKELQTFDKLFRIISLDEKYDIFTEENYSLKFDSLLERVKDLKENYFD